MLAGKSTELEVERERARRLQDRFSHDAAEDTELARERRAHSVSAEFLKEGDGHRLLGNLKGARERECLLPGLEELEAKLELRRQRLLRELAAEADAELVATCTDDHAALADALREAFENLSLRSIVDFRNSGRGVLAAEATATAAACVIANLDDAVKLSIHKLDPDQTWIGALDVLSKSGQFLDSLKHFTASLNAGRVPEENIVAARHFLSMAEGDRNPSLHPSVFGLQRWLKRAIACWEASGGSPSTVPVPKPSPKPILSRQRLQDVQPRAAGGAFPRESRPNRRVTGGPTTAALPSQRMLEERATHATSPNAFRNSRGPMAPPAKAPASSSTPTGAAAGSLLRRASPRAISPGATRPAASAPMAGTRKATSPSPPPALMATGGSSSSSFRFGATSHRTSSPERQPQQSVRTRSPARSQQDTRPRSVKLTTPTSASAIPAFAQPQHQRQSQLKSPQHLPFRSQPNLQRPQQQQQPIQQLQSTHQSQPHQQMLQEPQQRQQQSLAVSQSLRTSNSSANGVAATGSRSTAVSPAPSVRRSSAISPAPSTRGRRAEFSPNSSVNRKSNPGTNNDRASLVPSRSAGILSPSARATTPTVTLPGVPIPGTETLPSLEELRMLIEETKKEVRDMKAEETKTKWQMTREEQSWRAAAHAAEAAEIQNWRWKQADEMKAYVEAKAQEVKEIELQDSKEFVEFKRETKVRTKEEEIAFQQEVYAQSMERAQWERERLRLQFEEEQVVAREKVADVQELREERQISAQQERQQQEQDRLWEEHLEMAKLMKELQREKEKLSQSLHYQRSCKKVSPQGSNIACTWATRTLPPPRRVNEVSQAS